MNECDLSDAITETVAGALRDGIKRLWLELALNLGLLYYCFKFSHQTLYGIISINVTYIGDFVTVRYINSHLPYRTILSSCIKIIMVEFTIVLGMLQVTSEMIHFY